MKLEALPNKKLTYDEAACLIEAAYSLDQVGLVIKPTFVNYARYASGIVANDGGFDVELKTRRDYVLLKPLVRRLLAAEFDLKVTGQRLDGQNNTARFNQDPSAFWEIVAISQMWRGD